MRESIQQLVNLYLLSEERRTTVVKRFSRQPVSMSVPAHAHDTSYAPLSHVSDSEAHHSLGRSWPFILSTSGWGPTVVNTWQVIPGCTLTETFVDCYLLLDCWATIEDCNAAGREARLQFRRDGLECTNTGADQTLVGANARVEDCGQRVSIANHTVLTLSAGSYTVDARMRVSNLAIDITSTQCEFRVTEVPR